MKLKIYDKTLNQRGGSHADPNPRITFNKRQIYINHALADLLGINGEGQIIIAEDVESGEDFYIAAVECNGFRIKKQIHGAYMAACAQMCRLMADKFGPGKLSFRVSQSPALDGQLRLFLILTHEAANERRLERLRKDPVQITRVDRPLATVGGT